MKLLTKAIRDKLIANHEINANNVNSTDFYPVVKLFSPYSRATWLLTELDPTTNVAFGLCDLGMGHPELGDVSIDELEGSVTKWGGKFVERDMYWDAEKPLSVYASEARTRGAVVV